MAVRDVIQSAAGATGDSKTYIEDVFSTYLYTGNGSTQTINNGIDLAGQGGFVWIKDRTSGTNEHRVYDTVRGVVNSIATNTTAGQATQSTSLTAFNSNGFSIGASSTINTSSNTYASWTFRKAPKFFDVVTYTGNGSTTDRTISHNLGAQPGIVIIKCTSMGSDWTVAVISSGTSYFWGGKLNSTSAFGSGNIPYNYNSTMSATVFNTYIGASPLDTNASGATYVAYLFAHDTTTDGLIQCGSYTVGADGYANISLGWEPQYVLIKNSSATGSWRVFDNMRGMNVSGTSVFLNANTSDAESNWGNAFPTATGFSIQGIGASGVTGIYMAIRRGPMRTPTDGTKVFQPITATGSTGTARTTGFPVDMMFTRARTVTADPNIYDRLRGFAGTSTTGSNTLITSTTGTESTPSQSYAYAFDNTSFKDGVYANTYSTIWSSFRRAPGFFDVVCYTGTGAARTVNHNLGVTPELMIVKCRSTAGTAFRTYSSTLGATQFLNLQTTAAASTNIVPWNNTNPTASVFTVGTDLSTNNNTYTYVAYLFASCLGVSKVGSYTGNGSSQTINCGFAAGARFVMIKRTDSTGDWYVWDTARGIVSGNDPHLSLNTTAAEVTTNDTIDPDASGFVVNQVAATNVNVNAATYIYLAIA